LQVRISIIISIFTNSLLESFSYFSLCRDESTDNRHVSQISSFTRIVQNDFSHVEELLDFFPLHGITKCCDIFKTVNQTLEKFGIDFSRCSVIVTNGARVTIESKNGFGQIKQRDLKFSIFIVLFIKKRYVGKSLNCAVQCKPSLK